MKTLRPSALRRYLPCMVLCLIVTSGCTRTQYRWQADNEVIDLVNQKAYGPYWDLNDFRIYPSCESRYFDPTAVDYPAMPPDDPAAHKLMECVDCKPGYPCWHQNGDVGEWVNPQWASYLPMTAEGQLVLDFTAAYQLALLNNTTYQTNFESLYLSALDVAFERFRFDAQFFGGFTPSYEVTGGEGGRSTSTFGLGSDIEVNRLFASGGELAAGFANQLVWQVAGPDQYSSRSIANFSFFQPLLRFGGRQVVLERLTLSERVLLSNVRQMFRYQQGFYVQAFTGRSAGPGPSRQGGVLGGAGLSGFTGTGGGFGGIGNIGGGGGIAGGSGAAQAGGYLGLLQDQQQIRNAEANVAGLRDSLAQLQAAYDAGRIDRFQVELARQALYEAQSRLITSKAGYESTLDGYKADLGLPPSVDVLIDSDFLDQFKLIDVELTQSQIRINDMLERLRAADQQFTDTQLRQQIGLALDIRRQAAGHVGQVEADFEKLEQAVPARKRSLELLLTRDEVKTGDVDRSAYSPEQLDVRIREVTNAFEGLLRRSEQTWLGLEQLRDEQGVIETAEARRQLVLLLTDLSGQILELSLLQAQVRLEAVTLVPIDVAPARAFQVARRLRPDMMNARAAVINTWRLIEFNANRLRSDLNLVFDGDIRTRTNNPFAFNDTTGRLNVGLEFDAPLTRLSERNLYRESLIEYQRARRSYMNTEDQLSQGLRNTLRTIELNQLNLELRRAAVLIAINQVNLTRLRLNQPPRPGETSEFGDTTSRDLISAQSDLLSAQNDFLSVWVNYEAQRISLDFDLGTMQLDDRMMWIDPGAMTDADLPDFGGILPEIDNLPDPTEMFRSEDFNYFDGQIQAPDGGQPAELPAPDQLPLQEGYWPEPGSGESLPPLPGELPTPPAAPPARLQQTGGARRLSVRLDAPILPPGTKLQTAQNPEARNPAEETVQQASFTEPVPAAKVSPALKSPPAAQSGAVETWTSGAGERKAGRHREQDGWKAAGRR